MLSLREVQESFFRSLARVPGGGSAHFDPALVRTIEGRGQLGPQARIDIYARMYFARLLEVLHEDFPRVAAILGCERFDAISRTYLARHPSTNPSLRHLGRHFAEFLNIQKEIHELPFLGDLARLEWARLEVFDAPDVEPLRIESLHKLAPDDWPELRLQLIPAYQTLRSDWPVQEIWAAAESAAPQREGFQPETTTLRVWREGFAVYHTKMDAAEQQALDCLGAGESFAMVCAALEALLPTEEAAATAGSLLLRWIEDGILADLS
jgi:hypothetical protein